MAVWTVCQRCQGSGIEPSSGNGGGKREPCKACNGAGGAHV